MNTLIKPPCCNGTTTTPLNSQLLANLERAEAMRLGFSLSRENIAYIIAVQYYEQSAQLVSATSINDIMAEYYSAIWSTAYSGVGFDAQYETLLIEVERPFAEIVIAAFNSNEAPKDNSDLQVWLCQYKGKIIKNEPQRIDPRDRNETVPTIIVLRDNEDGNSGVRVSNSLVSYNFFGCEFRHGNYASSIINHINNLLVNNDVRLIRELQKDLKTNGTFKILCTDTKYSLLWDGVLNSWQPIDLNKPNFFKKADLKKFMTIML